MDEKTIHAYNHDAESYLRTWSEQETPLEKHPWIIMAFRKNAATADIGCGSGREVAWLNDKGYPCVGYDASEALLKHAINTYPQLNFQMAKLPDLTEIENESFQNILCQTVLMHLPEFAIEGAMQNLFRILKSEGSLILSFREGKNLDSSNREKDDRLYTNISLQRISSIWKNLGGLVKAENTKTLSRTGTPLYEVWLFKQ